MLAQELDKINQELEVGLKLLDWNAHDKVNEFIASAMHSVTKQGGGWAHASSKDDVFLNKFDLTKSLSHLRCGQFFLNKGRLALIRMVVVTRRWLAVFKKMNIVFLQIGIKSSWLLLVVGNPPLHYPIQTWKCLQADRIGKVAIYFPSVVVWHISFALKNVLSCNLSNQFQFQSHW